MQARVAVEHYANPATADPQYREKLQPKIIVSNGKPKVDWIWPVGTVVEGEKAKSLVGYGLAEPLDQECADACGMTAADVAKAIENQQMAQLGIHSKDDQTLYRMGIIKGFKPKAGGGVEYDWGPNAAAYKEALKAIKEQEAKDE